VDRQNPHVEKANRKYFDRHDRLETQILWLGTLGIAGTVFDAQHRNLDIMTSPNHVMAIMGLGMLSSLAAMAVKQIRRFRRNEHKEYLNIPTEVRARQAEDDFLAKAADLPQMIKIEFL
jgi:hypothetical protein